ncbi:MAG: MoxR family ATPase [Chloroflexota bacterium]|nr:MoxR family ATPase [Chloroflexota bacterium]
MLEQIAYGWAALEPALWASIALGWPVILQGRHGLAKTTALRAIATALDGQCRLYNAPVEDLISIAGIPNPARLAEGVFACVPHERTIWDADIVVIDELPRARKETQNLFLEILQEKTLLGRPLKWQVVVATMNPDTYAASYRMDAALGDRFCLVLPVPEHQGELDDAARRQLLAVVLADDAPVEELASRLTGLPGLLGDIKGNYARLARGLCRLRRKNWPPCSSACTSRPERRPRTVSPGTSRRGVRPCW